MMAAIPSLGDQPMDRPGDPITADVEGGRQPPLPPTPPLPPPSCGADDKVLGEYMEVDIILGPVVAEEEEEE